MGKKDVYNKAKEVFGIDAQITKAIEELAELQKELCKFILDDGNMARIIEEIADAKIMVEQLEMIFECKAGVKTVKGEKVCRLSDRICEECIFVSAPTDDICGVKCVNFSYFEEKVK